jgi:SAM-dependent methyltransferase
MRDYGRFDSFLNTLAGDVYPEVPSEPHLSITRTMINSLYRDGLIGAGARVLDIGCGQGVALEQFAALGLEAIGITLGPDAELCRGKGFDVREMDQNFMDFPDSSFDLLWCRHVLEHSIAPLFTLFEYRRVAKPGGLVYVEVPAPDTSANHQRNPNHYSVLPMSSWLNLFGRAGFVVERANELRFNVRCGPDVYWSSLLRCPAQGATSSASSASGRIAARSGSPAR